MSYFLYSGTLHIHTPAVLDKLESAHLLLSRRTKLGEYIEVQDANFCRFICTVSKLGKKEITITPLRLAPLPPNPPRQVNIRQAYIAEQALHTVIQKLTELGAHSLTIFPAKYSPIRPVESKLPRWQRISIEAAKQSGRPAPIEIQISTLANLLPSPPSNHIHIFLSQNSPAPLSSIVSPTTVDTPINLWIGPEGGWSPEEESLLTTAGLRPASLGPYTLRAETAAISATAIALIV